MRAQMESQLNFAMYLGLAALVAGLISAVVALAMLLSSPGKHRAVSRLLVTAVIAFLAFLIGTWLGIQYFCTPDDAGNLCGLGGVFGTGPLATGLGLMAGAYLMLKARHD